MLSRTKSKRQYGRSSACRLLLLAALGASLAAGCAEDSEPPESKSRDTRVPELTNTATKPVIELPTGTPPRRLVKDDLVRGSGRPARRGDVVLLHYVGVIFSNGAEFGSSWEIGEPFPFQLGSGIGIEGWEKGLAGIRKGGRRMVTVPPELGYGREGFAPRIPPNETLVYVFDAVDVKRAARARQRRSRP